MGIEVDAPANERGIGELVCLWRCMCPGVQDDAVGFPALDHRAGGTRLLAGSPCGLAEGLVGRPALLLPPRHVVPGGRAVTRRWQRGVGGVSARSALATPQAWNGDSAIRTAWASRVARSRRFSASSFARSGSNTSAFYQAARGECGFRAHHAHSCLRRGGYLSGYLK